MKPQIFHGSLYHERTAPTVHKFTYPIFMFSMPVEDLTDKKNISCILGLNRFNIFSIYTDDYLTTDRNSLFSKILTIYAKNGIRDMPAKSILVTVPRVLGYVFNPASFYISLTKTGKIHSVVSEVNNTFGEKHYYLLQSDSEELPFKQSFSKDFFVSPFYDTKGEYTFILKSLDPLEISILLSNDGNIEFRSELLMTGYPLTFLSLLKTFLIFPLTALLTMPRIHLEAAYLYFKKGVNVYLKPIPAHPNTIRSKQLIIHKLRNFVLSLSKRIRKCTSI